MKPLILLLPRLLFAASLALPALIFYPHAQHAFWTAESWSAVLLVPPTALLALALSPAPKQPISQQQAPIAGLMYALVGLWFLSAAFAFRKDLAARELAGWLCYPLIFLAGHRLASNKVQHRRFIWMALAVGVLQSLYGLLQSAGWEPLAAKAMGALGRSLGLPTFGFEALNWAVTFNGRAGSFLGNPNFLGGHLALLLPLALALAMDGRRGRWLGWLLSSIISAGLIVSQTRGAWLGAGVGLAATLWLCHRRMPGLLQRNRRPLQVMGALALLTAIAFFAAHRQNLGRLGGLLAGDEEFSRRLILMQAALKIAAEHPLLGVGPGNFRIHFPTAQLVGLAPAQQASRPYIYSEHAHNDFLQMAADTGFPAALLWAILMLWFLRLLWQAAAQVREEDPLRQGAPKDPLFLCGLFGGLVALAVHGLANFPFLILPTQMTAWALSGLAWPLLANAFPQSAKAQSNIPAAMTASQRRHGIYSAAAFVKSRWWRGLIGLALWSLAAWHAGRELHKDALWWMGQGEISLGNSERGREVVFKALEIDRREDRLWYQHGLAQLDLNHTINATGSLKEALRLNPYSMEARVQLGRAQVALGQWKEAEETLKLVARYAPNLGELWEPLAAALYMQSKFEEAARAYDWALLFNPANAPALLDNKAAALGSLGRFAEALQVLSESQRRDPNRAKVYINKAVTYLKMGLKTLAREQLAKARSLDPKNPQLPDLIRAAK